MDRMKDMLPSMLPSPSSSSTSLDPSGSDTYSHSTNGTGVAMDLPQPFLRATSMGDESPDTLSSPLTPSTIIKKNQDDSWKDPYADSLSTMIDSFQEVLEEAEALPVFMEEVWAFRSHVQALQWSLRVRNFLRNHGHGNSNEDKESGMKRGHGSTVTGSGSGTGGSTRRRSNNRGGSAKRRGKGKDESESRSEVENEAENDMKEAEEINERENERENDPENDPENEKGDGDEAKEDFNANEVATEEVKELENETENDLQDLSEPVDEKEGKSEESACERTYLPVNFSSRMAEVMRVVDLQKFAREIQK